MAVTLEYDVLPVVQRAGDVPGPPQGQWTYDDYARLPDDGRRYEIIEGVLYVAPSPDVAHQTAVGWIFYYLLVHVQLAGKGRVFSAPIDVELSPARVVQPDVVVVLAEHASIITPARIVGAPDLVVEVASPGTAGYDRREKQDVYVRSGVPEYWVADTYARTIEVLVLEGSVYRSRGVFRGKATLPSQVIPQFPVQVEQFFV